MGNLKVEKIRETERGRKREKSNNRKWRGKHQILYTNSVKIIIYLLSDQDVQYICILYNIIKVNMCWNGGIMGTVVFTPREERTKA